MNKIESASLEPRAEGDRRSEGARAPDRHPEPAPVVRTADDACGREGDGGGPVLAGAVARRLFQGEPREVHRVARRRCTPRLRRSRPGTREPPVATTEPVADYLLQAMGMNNLTPFAFQADIMNGVDPAPEDITLENGFFTKHQVKVFCYNQQVVDSLTPRSARLHCTPACRWSGCMRRCRLQDMTSSPGCWPRSTRSRRL